MSSSEQEKDKAKANDDYRKYERYLELAKQNKLDYLQCKELQKENSSEALSKLVAMYKNSAIHYWEQSQKFLEKYNEFINRKTN